MRGDDVYYEYGSIKSLLNSVYRTFDVSKAAFIVTFNRLQFLMSIEAPSTNLRPSLRQSTEDSED